MGRRWLMALWALLLLSTTSPLGSGIALAQGEAAVQGPMAAWLGRPVVETHVVWEGPAADLDLEPILEVKEGEPLTPFLLERNVLLLHSVGVAEDVRVEAREAQGGVALVFRIYPLPVIESVDIRRPVRLVESIKVDRAVCLSNRGPGELELRRLISLRPGHTYRPEDLERIDGPIKDAYVEAGFGENSDDVDIQVIEKPAGKGRMHIVIVVEAVCPRIVSRVRFKGVSAAEARELENLVRLRVGDYYDPQEAEADRRRLLEFYRQPTSLRWCRGRGDGDDDGGGFLGRLARRECAPLIENHIGYGDDRLSASVVLKAQRASNNTVALIYEVDKGPRVWLDFFVIGVPSFGPMRGFVYRKVAEFLGTDRQRLLGSRREALKTLLDLENERHFSTGFIEEAQDTLAAHYRSEGYNDVRVRVRKSTHSTDENLRFVVTIRLGDVRPIHEVSAEGMKFLDEETFVALFKESMAQNAPWNVYTEEAFQRAPALVLDYYRSQGFKSAFFDVVDSREVPGPFGPRMVISTTIVEGPRTLVRSVQIDGVEALTEAEVREVIRLRVGDPYNPDRARESERAIANLYRSRGFLDVQVSGVAVEEREDGHHVAFRLWEGPRHTFGVTLVQGNRKTRDRVITRELTFEPGAVYDPEKVRAVQSRLMSTGVFRGVEIRPLTGDDSREDLLVSVYERTRIEASTTFGISVDDWLEASLSLAHNNVLGFGHRASLLAELAGMSRSLRFNDLLSAEQFAARVAASTGSKVEFTYQQPHVGGSNFSSTYRISLFERDFKTNYRIIRNSLSWSVAQQLRPNLQTYTTLQTEGRRPVDDASLRSPELWSIWDVDREPRYGGSAAAGFVYTTRFGSKQASGVGRGFLLGGQVELSQLYTVPEDTGGVTLPGRDELAERFGRVSGRATWAEPWFSWLRTEVRLNGGYAHAFAGSEGAVPVEKRFYLGGATTVRGYLLDQIGPVIVDEAAFSSLTGIYTTIPTGGNAFASYTLELIFPLGAASGALAGWELGVFHDGGNVYWTGESKDTFLGAISDVYDDFSQSDPGPIPTRPEDRCDPIGPVLRTSYGAGLRYQTPVGPLRLDLARNTAPRCFEPSLQIHFSIGLF